MGKLFVGGMFADLPVDPDGKFQELIRPGHTDAAGGPHSHRFEILGAHHRPHSGAPRRIPGFGEQTGERDQIFAGRTDADHLDLRVLQFLLDPFLGIKGILSPEMPGIANLDLALIDPDIAGLFGATGDQQVIVAGKFELRPPVGTEIGFGPQVAHGRKGGDIHPARTRQRRAGEGSGVKQ